ncbi:hypothetical protein AVEN_109778-1 [Araneus ventricosus]|uniref:Uncharacterized protein n=1 Tax=Araneus ventricosus TaxID=182803 RepID=A0A4Y2QPX3_ARAVE|nr:hypothetical protein AVEN_109778-1 [Araneus ventricosus]
MVMDDVESFSRFIDQQVAFEFDFIKSALSSETTSDHRCSVPSCTDITSGDDTSTLLDFFSDPSIDLKSVIKCSTQNHHGKRHQPIKLIYEWMKVKADFKIYDDRIV